MNFKYVWLEICLRFVFWCLEFSLILFAKNFLFQAITCLIDVALVRNRVWHERGWSQFGMVNLRLFFFKLPSARNGRMTKPASAVIDVVLFVKIALPFYQNFVAVVTIGMAAFMPGNISQIDIMDPFLQGQIPKLFQGFYGCRWQSGQFVL